MHWKVLREKASSDEYVRFSPTIATFATDTAHDLVLCSKSNKDGRETLLEAKVKKVAEHSYRTAHSAEIGRSKARKGHLFNPGRL